MFGIYSEQEQKIAEIAYFGIYALQHRGQEGAGIAVSDADGIHCSKGKGLVVDIFKTEMIRSLPASKVALGCVQYSEMKRSGSADILPLVAECKTGGIAIATNGKLCNYNELSKELLSQGAILQTQTDSEIVANLLTRQQCDIITAVKNVMDKLKGAYVLMILAEQKLIIARDPNGFQPLSIGKGDGFMVVASENCAFDAVHADFVRDVLPGEIIVLDESGLRSEAVKAAKSSLCVFEYVYFARTDSCIEGLSVYQARQNLGKQLAKEHPVDADMVFGVPDSALQAAMGFAEEMGIPYSEGLSKNRYIGRTFIQPEQWMREQSVRIKLNAIRSNVEGKRVVVVDDSIVRGTTSKNIVQMIKAAGAKEVHMRISSPPFMHLCHFGIDIPRPEHLVSYSHTKEEIREMIGADSLHYLGLDGLKKAVESANCGFCMGCFTGKYPIDI